MKCRHRQRLYAFFLHSDGGFVLFVAFDPMLGTGLYNKLFWINCEVSLSKGLWRCLLMPMLISNHQQVWSTLVHTPKSKRVLGFQTFRLLHRCLKHMLWKLEIWKPLKIISHLIQLTRVFQDRSTPPTIHWGFVWSSWETIAQFTGNFESHLPAAWRKHVGSLGVQYHLPFLCYHGWVKSYCWNKKLLQTTSNWTFFILWVDFSYNHESRLVFVYLPMNHVTNWAPRTIHHRPSDSNHSMKSSCWRIDLPSLS